MKTLGYRLISVVLIAVMLLGCLPFSALAAQEYTVSYDANGGSGAPAAQVKTAGVALILSNIKPTRSGYVFQGWAKTVYGDPVYQPGGNYTGQGATLYAVWTASCTSCGGDGRKNVNCTTCGGKGYYVKRYSTCCNYSVAETIGAYGTMFYQCQYCWRVCQTQSKRVDCSPTQAGTCSSCSGVGWKKTTLPTPTPPVLSAVTENSITVEAGPQMCYSIDGGATWQTESTFTGLKPGTAYTVVRYCQGGKYYNASAPSEELRVTTVKSQQGAPAAPTLNYASQDFVGLDYIADYEYSMDGVLWQESPDFYDLQPGTTYTFYQRKIATDSSDASPASPGLTVTTPGIGSLVTGQVVGNPGDTVTVEIVMEKNPNLAKLDFYVDFDPEGLEIVDVKEGVVFADGVCNVYPDSLEFSMYDEGATTNNTKTGVLVYLTFKINDSARVGTCELCPVVTYGCNIDEMETQFAVSDGGVTISCGNHRYVDYKSNVIAHWMVCSTCKFRTEMEAHEYDHGCDKYCNICQRERVTRHEYQWNSDETGHWMECIGCKDAMEPAPHTPGAEATDTTPQTCTECDYVITPVLNHNHEYSSEWTMNDSAHWQTCSGCPEKGSYAQHSFTDACDTDCADCGYLRKTEHHFETKWTVDENGHYHICSACGAKDSEAPHTPDDHQVCTLCGYALGADEESKPTQQPDEPQEAAPINWWVFAIIAALTAVCAVLGFLLFRKKKQE